ncbi:transketolase family protein [Hungatella hathewayi]|uniref:transketolase family protein n=1 Tax=Hungatella hathewayi TaxID=154046 RepID=UPI0035637A21
MAEPAMREAYGDALLMMGEDERVVVLEADLAKATSSCKFAAKYPERFFDMGIAEQNLMGTAAGMAISGLKPFASTFALFAAGRAYEPIRNAVCYAKAPVKIVATHAGLSPNSDGGSHETIEDIALMRVLPGMTVLSPCDYRQALDMVLQMKDMDHPAYIRMSRHPVETVTAEGSHTEIGKIDVLREGGDVCFTATGVMVAEALLAAEALEEKGIHAAVLNVHTIKPLDKETLIRYGKSCGCMVTAEEHSVIGGLGSAVAEVLSECGGCRLKRVGIQDKFGQSGDLGELMESYGLTAENLIETALKLMEEDK